MLAALVIVFREVLEAGLIVGIVLAASRGVPGRSRAVGLGILAGVLGSMVVAGFATQISSAFDGRGQELFTAGVLALAVLMLTWHVAWMADHARELTAHLKEVGRAVTSGNQSIAALGHCDGDGGSARRQRGGAVSVRASSCSIRRRRSISFSDRRAVFCWAPQFRLGSISDCRPFPCTGSLPSRVFSSPSSRPGLRPKPCISFPMPA